MRKVIVVPVVIGALGAVSVNFKEHMKRIGVNVKLGSYPENSTVGDSKDTKESTDSVKKEGKESPGTCGDLL